MLQVTFGTEWEGQPSPTPMNLTEEAESTITEKLNQITELKNELDYLTGELEIVETEELDLEPAKDEEVTYEGTAPELEEKLKNQRYENEAAMEVLAMEINSIQETGVVI